MGTRSSTEPVAVEVVVDPFTRATVPVELPLRFRTEPEEARRALGLPDYLDVSDPVVRRAVGLLHALAAVEPSIPVAFFGGVAYRIRSPTSNGPTSGLRRNLHDIDLACLQPDGRRMTAALLALGPRGGSALTVVETHADHMFNALQSGLRLRFHMIDHVDEQGRATLGTIDVVANEFRFCHNLDLRADVAAAPSHARALSPESLLLTKLQAIQSIPAEHGNLVPGRVLGPFGKRDLLIGPEEKDVRDVLALLADRTVGDNGTADVSADRFIAPLANDWGFWTTVRLNLDNLGRSPLLPALPPAVAERIRSNVGRLRAATDRVQPKRRFGFLQKEWWEPVESLGTTPPPTGPP